MTKVSPISADIVKFPSKSVDVPSDEPTIIIDAPGSGTLTHRLLCLKWIVASMQVIQTKNVKISI